MKLLYMLPFVGFATLIKGEEDKMFVPEGFEVTLWAESPMLYNPTNMDVDDKGRVWVTEAVEYREFSNDPAKRFNFKGKGDRVVILEDTDGDGKADKSKVFVQDTALVAPLGIAVFDNKVIVSTAPNVIVYTDTNRDDVADKKEIFLTGFGGKDHDHSLHSFMSTPYGKYLFNVGNAGPHMVTDKSGWSLRSGTIYTGGSPYNSVNSGNRVSDDGRVWVGGMALEIDPKGTQMKVLGHNFRNSYEVVMDSYGNMWQNDNDDQVIACRTSWLMEGSNAGFFSSDGNRYWNADRRPGQDLFTAHWHQEDPGVLSVGDKTGAGSPTGMMVYEGDAFGDAFKGMVLSCEAGRNVVWGYHVKPQGAGFEMKKFDLLGSSPANEEHYIWHENVENQKNKWFRPSDAVTGTDGSIFVADWYDPVVGGHRMMDTKGYGRIYRITPKNKTLKTPTYNFETKEGLLEAMASPANNVRHLAFMRLKEMGNSVLADVVPLMNQKDAILASRFMYLVAQLGPNGQEAVKNILPKSEGEIQVAAFRALKKSAYPVINLSNELLKSQNNGLKREISIALRDENYAASKDILQDLADNFDGKDKNLLTAIGIGVDKKSKEFGHDYLQKLPKDPLSLSEAQSGILFEIHPEEALGIFVKRANATALAPAQRKQAITSIAFINTVEAVKAMITLSKSKLVDVASQAQYWVTFRKGNTWENLVPWKKLDKELLSPAQQQMMVMRDKMLSKAGTEAQKSVFAEKLSKDGFGARLLLSEAAKGTITPKLKEVINQHIFNNPDLSIRSMAADYFTRTGGKSLSVDLAVNMPSTPLDGKKIFDVNCANCHKMGEEGAEIGPDLSLISKKFDKNGLLDAIINPSASLAFGYEPWIVNTVDNSYYGFLLGDGANVIIKDLVGKQTIIKAKDVKSKTQLKNSLMPDPVSMGLNEKQLSDLAGYLLRL